MEFRYWLSNDVIIYIKSIVNTTGTWKLEALYQGDHEDCQCQGSKCIKGNKESCLLTNMYGNLYCDLNFLELSEGNRYQ